MPTIQGHYLVPTDWRIIWPEPSGLVPTSNSRFTPAEASITEEVARPKKKGIISSFVSWLMDPVLFTYSHSSPATMLSRIQVLPKLDPKSITLECHGSEFDSIGKVHDVIIEGYALIGLKASSKTAVDWETGNMTVCCSCVDFFELNESEYNLVYST